MKAIDRVLETYAEWLQTHHADLDVAAAKSAARGILMVAGVARVTQAHVDQSVELARDANCAEDALAAIAEQGTLLLEFQADNSVRWDPPPVVPVVTFRTKTADASPAETAIPPEPRAAPRRRAAGFAAAAILAVASAVGLWWYVGRPDVTAPSETRTAKLSAPNVPGAKAGSSHSRLGETGLEVELPADWTYASDRNREQPGPLGAPLRTARAFAKGSGGDPEHELLVGTTKLPPDLSGQRPLSDDLLLSIVHFVEYNIASKVQARGVYKPGTCEVFNDSSQRRAAVCGGDAYSLSETSSVHTYVRMDGDRAVIALFVAAESVVEPRRIADRIFRSMR